MNATLYLFINWWGLNEMEKGMSMADILATDASGEERLVEESLSTLKRSSTRNGRKGIF
jgi:hypothetical protein